MTTARINPQWLPDKKYYEYMYHKFFNPEVTYDSWSPWDKWDYPERDLLRFNHIIGQQLAHIQNKRVLDVACHLGYLSLFCLHNGASYVTGTNVRDRELAIAKEVVDLSGHTNFEFINSDIRNIEEFYKLCNLQDTVLLSGIMYHINNHYQVLESVANSSAQTLIIESMLTSSLDIGSTPIINWTLEDVTDPTMGFENNKLKVFVGVPNHRWIEEAMMQVGFKIVYNEIFEYSKSDGKLDRRCVVVGQKS